MRSRQVTLFGIVAVLAALVLAGAAEENRFHKLRSGEALNGFSLCRLAFVSDKVAPDNSGNNRGWSTDYPQADINLLQRLSELTMAGIYRVTDPGHTAYPQSWLIWADSPEIFRCPVVLASDVGRLRLSDDEADNLREYLLKGGFLWADDFWGDNGWSWWEHKISEVLPPNEYPILTLVPSHPIFHTLFSISEVWQITDFRTWSKYESLEFKVPQGLEFLHLGEVRVRAIFDHDGRMMVLMTHNTDIGSSWERWQYDSGNADEYFKQFSPHGYQLGINVLLYNMTH